ncbi:hypothetical protein GCK32_004694 [Trichostrongylus colubriformis]|uniref:Uncharacterized protein n=1 Tax=Trichostrongylus colubriformis TaxID=6319 RepID=A0AAN8FH01_TRICO
MQVSGRIATLFVVLAIGTDANYTSFVDDETKEVGLRDNKGNVCLSVTFAVTIINLNINDTDNRIPKNVLVKKYEELRWQLRKVVYSETYDGNSHRKLTYNRMDRKAIFICANGPVKEHSRNRSRTRRPYFLVSC